MKATVVGILSDEQGNDFAVDINAASTAVVAMEAIKQDSVSVDLTVALGNMIKAQAVAIDEVSPTAPSLTITKDSELKISFSTILTGGYAVVVGDMVEIFEADNSVTTYVLQKADIDKRNYTFQLPVSDDIDTSYTATIMDIAGNISKQSESVVYDTVAPIITSGASGSVVEGSGAGIIVYTANANEDGVTFSPADDSLDFSIDASTGVVTTKPEFSADFEKPVEYVFSVIATDASGNDSSALEVSIDVINVDEEAPSITSGDSLTAVNENSGAGQVVYTATATDTDANIEGIILSLADDALGFSIDASTGVVTTNAVFAADFEVAQSQSFVVVATDVAGNASQQTVSVAVNNVDEAAPVFQSSTTASVLESELAGVAVYQVQVDDSSDISNGVTYILSGVDALSFVIDEDGEVSIIDNPEAAVKSSYSFTVIADDGVNQSQITVTLSVVTEPDTLKPVFTSSATPTINENIGGNQVVYNALATDDFVVTYSLQAGHDSGLSIDTSTGEVSLDVNPDSYTKNEYSFTVVATDSSDNSSELAVTLTVIEIDDVAPVITPAATATSIEESSGAGQVIYKVTSDDAQATYSLKTGIDSAQFTINATTGDVTLTANPVYSTKGTYSFVVLATDAAGNVSEPQSVTLTIIEVTAGNLVTDGTFDEVTSTTWTGNAYNPVNGVNVADVPSVGNAYDVNLSGTVDLTPGATYTLTFDVIGAEGRTIVAGIGQSSDPWFNNTETVTLSASSQTMVLHLTAKADGVGADFGDATSRVIFDMGADTGAVNIDNVSLVAGHTGTVNLGAGNDTGGDTPPAYGPQGPLDLTAAYGDGVVSGEGDEAGQFFKNDSSEEKGFSGFALNYVAPQVNPFIENPLTFGTGGTLVFTASVPTSQPVDVSFTLQHQSSTEGVLCEIGTVWESAATTVYSAIPQEFTIVIPPQAGDTFSNMIMELSAYDIDVKITDVYVTTSQKTVAEQTVPARCDGSLDMTEAYGDGAVSGEGEEAGTLFMNDTSIGEGYSGFANKTLDVYPYEFGSGGTLEFTASVPEGQATTAVDVKFQFQKQGNSSGDFCDIAPIWEASNTVSGPVEQTFTVAIPSQGGNTFSNLIMELSVVDVIVKISGVKVTPSAKTADAPTIPCAATNLPSVYPVNGFNTAALLNGTYGAELVQPNNGGTDTTQIYDVYEAPSPEEGSDPIGGWSNSNQTLYPIEYTGGGFFAQKKIYFCASTAEAVTVYFRFENEVYPANSIIYNTAEVSLLDDEKMHAYEIKVPIVFKVNSLVFLMSEEDRDKPITMGKVMGNWNGLPTQNITNDSDNDGVVDYCEDFPNDTPDWVDPDGDGASNEVDAFPNDKNEYLDTDGDKIGNNADNDDDGDGVVDESDYAPLDPEVQTGPDANP
jgi:hypothetical protein